MPEVFLFTDSDPLPVQDSGLAFGSTGSTSFRLTSSFTGLDSGSELPAYAVCKGSVLIQEVDGHADLVNLVLKPERQPNPHYAAVEFFVYRGLQKKHFLDGTGEVIGEASADLVTDLMIRMWEVRNQLNDDMAAVDEAFVAEGLTRGDLGLHEQADPALDGETRLAELFDTYTFPTVSAGDLLGEFETGENYGFEILLVDHAYRHVLDDVRSLEHTVSITYDAGQQQFPDEEDVSTRRRREQVLAYVDPAAWYGLLAGEEVSVYRSGSLDELSGEDLATEVLAKFHTADRIYLDLRSELNDSLDFYGEYGAGTTTIRWGEASGALTEADYHDGNGWPLWVLGTSDLSASADDALRLVLSLPKGASELLTVYLAEASLYDEFPERGERFVPLEFDGSDWSGELELGVRNNPAAGSAYPAAIRLSIGKRVDLDSFSAESSPSDRVLKNDLLDNLFAPRSIDLVEQSGHVVWRTLPHPYYVGWTSTSGWDFMVQSGVARDSLGEVAYCYRFGPPEIDGSTAAARSMADLNLASGLEPADSFFQVLEDLYGLARLEARGIPIGSGTEIACIRVASVHGHLSIAPFNRSADDLITLAYTEAERDDIVDLYESSLWDEGAKYYTALDKAVRSDQEDFAYFELELGVQGIVFDSASFTHEIDVVRTGLTFYSLDGKSFFTEAYAQALASLLES